MVRVRFLRMVARSILKVRVPAAELPSISKTIIENADRLEVEGNVFQPWQEAVEETIELTACNLSALASQPMQWPFRLSARRDREPIRDARGLIAGIIERRKASITGTIEFAATPLKPGLFKLTTRISNESRVEGARPIAREDALTSSLVSAHTILEVRGGEFISLIDPPEAYRDFLPACQNTGTWPVLVGDHGQRDTMLSSPIILYDYPETAPESPGDLFDGAEIDEILSLRIMTMTDEEKREMRQSDERARQILDRTEGLMDEQLKKLHGVLRGLRNVREEMP